jgi:hypothetical protein
MCYCSRGILAAARAGGGVPSTGHRYPFITCSPPIFFAAQAYQEIVQANPQVNFFILAGNHDLSRDSTHVSAMQLFEKMVPNVEVLTKPTRIGDDLLAIPSSPWKTAADVVSEINEGAVTAFGHWDLDGNGPNLIPTKALAQLGIKRVFNGHVHLPRRFERDGIEISRGLLVTGPPNFGRLSGTIKVHFLDSHLCDLCFGIDSERLGEQSLRLEHWNP